MEEGRKEREKREDSKPVPIGPPSCEPPTDTMMQLGLETFYKYIFTHVGTTHLAVLQDTLLRIAQQ